MHCRLFARDTIPLTPFAPRTHSIAAPQHLQPHLFLHTQPLQHLRRHQTAGFCSLMRSSFVVLICRLRKQQTAHFVTRYELYQGVLYFQNVTRFHSTRVNVVSFLPTTVQPSLCRLSRNAQIINTILSTEFYQRPAQYDCH